MNRRAHDIFSLLRTVRTRRVGYGYRIDSGTEERHPVTGRTMRQVLGPRQFVSSRQPLPLTSDEEALLAWAGLGPNGMVAWEAPLGAGFDQLTLVLGRTAPEPNNTLATDLVIVNDHGASLYRRPPATPSRRAERSAAAACRWRRGRRGHRQRPGCGGCIRMWLYIPTFMPQR